MDELRKIYILIVNDDPGFREKLTTDLIERGLIHSECINIAMNGELAIRIITSHDAPTYNLFIVGGNLQGKMKGPELIAKIRQMEDYKETPIVIASQHPKYIQEGVLAGATKYMEKPLDHLEEFLRRIFSILKLPYKGSRVFFQHKAGGLVAINEGEKMVGTLGSHKEGFQIIHPAETKIHSEDLEDGRVATIFSIP